MIESVREHVVHMLHTHDGARVAMSCLWHGTAKVGILCLVNKYHISYIIPYLIMFHNHNHIISYHK